MKGLTLVVLLMSATTMAKQIKIYNGKNISVPDITKTEGCDESDKYIQKCEILQHKQGLELCLPLEFCAQNQKGEKCTFDVECQSLRCKDQVCSGIRQERTLAGGRGSSSSSSGSRSSSSSSSSVSRTSYSYSYSTPSYSRSTVIVAGGYYGYGYYYGGLYGYYYYGGYTYVAGTTSAGVIIASIIVPLVCIIFIIVVICVIRRRKRDLEDQLEIDGDGVVHNVEVIEVREEHHYNNNGSDSNFGVEEVIGNDKVHVQVNQYPQMYAPSNVPYNAGGQSVMAQPQNAYYPQLYGNQMMHAQPVVFMQNGVQQAVPARANFEDQPFTDTLPYK